MTSSDILIPRRRPRVILLDHYLADPIGNETWEAAKHCARMWDADLIGFCQRPNDTGDRIAEMVDLVFEAEQQQEVGVTFMMSAQDSAFCLVAMPKRQYYYESPIGNALFDMGLGSLALAVVAISRPEEKKQIRALIDHVGPEAFPEKYLESVGLDWAVQIMQDRQQ